jgi:peptide/nickel transport system permease protein
MWKYIVKRVLLSVVTLFITTIAVAYLIHLIPGDPVRLMYAQSQGTTPEQLELVRQNLGLDRPIHEQYVMFISKIVRGDFGRTIRGDQPVLDLLLTRLPNTLLLTVAALLVAIVIGISLGFIAAYHRGKWLDTGTIGLAIVGISIPYFWLGLVLMYIFSMQLKILPVAGGTLNSLILPAVTLGISNAAMIARVTRSSMIEIFNQDYVRTAWAKGLPKSVILSRHVLRSGLIPIVSMIGLQFAFLMGGAIVVENVFAWNGIGRLAIEAIRQRDYPMIQGFILSFATIVIFISLAVDLLYAWLDPRIKYD